MYADLPHIVIIIRSSLIVHTHVITRTRNQQTHTHTHIHYTHDSYRRTPREL